MNSRRRPDASVLTSPVLIGALTVLVTIIAVALAYNANTGLPFVPTYNLHVQAHNAEELQRGDDVRVGAAAQRHRSQFETAREFPQGLRKPVGRHDAELERRASGLQHDRVAAFARARVDAQDRARPGGHYLGVRLSANETGMPPVCGYTSVSARAMM